jgi:Mg2+ and Co2+ transporter CorA
MLDRCVLLAPCLNSSCKAQRSEQPRFSDDYKRRTKAYDTKASARCQELVQSYKRSESDMAAPNQSVTRMTATIVDSAGVQPIAVATDLRERLTAGKFFWLDLVGGDESARLEFINQLGLESEDIAWLWRFEQAGRMSIRQHRLRAVTWLSDSTGTLAEVHLLGSRRWILTTWSGDVAALDMERQHFAEGASEFEKSPYLASGILLQLLLATLDEAISAMDARLYDIEEQLAKDSDSLDLAEVHKRLSQRQPTWARFERYSSSVRSAVVGVEDVPGIDARGAAELNDYADQVEDVEHRFRERIQWGSDAMHNYGARLAQRQSEQISRLTLVALIFLPITFLTGFFGMNFNWMISVLGSAPVFVALGILLPALSVVLTVLWLKRRRLL